MRSSKYWLGGMLLLLLLILPDMVSAREVLVKDQAWVMEENGRPAGLKLSRLWRTDTGYRYVIDMIYQLAPPDGETVQTETVKHLELTVDKSYFAESFVILKKNNHNGEISRSEGRLNADQLEITTTAPDGQVTSNNCQLGGPLYFGDSLYDYLGATGRLKAGESFQMNIFDPETLSVAEELFTVATIEYKYKNRNINALSITGINSREPVAYVNGKGDCYFKYDSRLKLSFRKIDPHEFPEFRYRLALNGMLPGDAKVTYPLRSVASRIRLYLNGWKPEESQLEDNRQKIKAMQTAGNQSELLCTIYRDSRDFGGRVTLPVKNKELAVYLGGSATDIIAPALPEVKRLAGEILGDESDGWRAARKLAGWIAANIQPGFLPKPLPTGEILARRAGMPAEFAVLFAALARAAGLPARIAAGLRFQNGVWNGYSWNEIWLGEWVAIDSFQNQVAPDALLLKLAHGETLPAVAKMSAEFTGNLKVNLADVQIPEPDTAEVNMVKTGIYGRTYINAEYHFRIKAPEDWRLIETTAQELPVLVVQPVTNENITGVLTMFRIPEGTTLEEYLAVRFPDLQVDIAHYLLVKQHSGAPETALFPVGTFPFSDNGIRFRRQNWLAVSGNRVFLLVYLTPEAEWAVYENDFSKLRESFTVDATVAPEDTGSFGK